jgi:hypothetical protein
METPKNYFARKNSRGHAKRLPQISETRATAPAQPPYEPRPTDNRQKLGGKKVGRPKLQLMQHARTS